VLHITLYLSPPDDRFALALSWNRAQHCASPCPPPSLPVWEKCLSSWPRNGVIPAMAEPRLQAFRRPVFLAFAVSKAHDKSQDQDRPAHCRA
jgi:hypothetical protein